MIVGIFAPVMDSTVVNVAINTIAKELNTSIDAIQWITTAYILAMGIAAPFAGWMDNRFSVKRVHIASLFIFCIGSVLSSLSWNIQSLIVFRIIQGIGAGIILPTLQTALIHYSGGTKIGSLMAIVGIPALIIPILGPSLGGLIVSNLPWRWIFYVNIPICFIALLLAHKLPKAEPINKKQSLDSIGTLLLSGIFITFILGISNARSLILSSGTLESMSAVIPFVLGLLFLIAFIIHSLQTKSEPVIDVRLFKLPGFSSSSLLIIISGIISTGTMFILPLFFQQVRGESALIAGLMLAPQGLGMLITRGSAGKLTDRIGARFVVLVGLVIVVIGTIPFMFINSQTNIIVPFISLLIRGAGLGGVFVPITASIYEGLKDEQISYGTITQRILQQIGGAFGTAILAIVFQHYLLFGNSQADAARAYNISFIWSICFTVFAIIPALFLPVKKAGN
jgi:EmrB/QacA subfamily drug resistance transporter